MSMNPRYCWKIIEGSCPFGERCRYRHDIRKCSCGRVIPLRHWLPHVRGKKHQRQLRAKKQREEARVRAAVHAAAAAGQSTSEPVERCDQCHKTLLASELAAHTEEHRRQEKFKELKEAEEEAELDKEGIEVSGKGGLDFGVLDTEDASIEILATVQNTNSFAVALQSCRMRSSARGDEHGKTFSIRLKGQNKSKLLKPGQLRSLSVLFHPSYAGQYEDTIELVFVILEPRKTFLITRRVTATVGSSEDYELLKAKAPYSRRKTTLPKITGEIVPSSRPAVWTKTSWAQRLPEFRVPEDLIEAAYGTVAQRSDRVAVQAIRRFMPETFDENTYGRWFQILLYIEEEKMKRDLDAYALTDAELDADFSVYKLKVEGLAENRPSVLVGDFINVRKMDELSRTDGGGTWFQGRVHQVHQNHVTLHFGEDFYSFRGTKFDVRFVLNRLPYRRMHYALTNKFNPARISFPDPIHIEGLKRVTDVQKNSFVPIFRLLREDEEQMETVTAIINQPPGSVPFVVFGPPGTGKTVTIVEAMQQLLQNPNTRILACAPSNSAADLIAMKLTSLGRSQVFRLNSLTRKIRDMPKSLRDFSLINENDIFVMPPVEDLRKYRVVVSTCLSGGVPANLGIKPGHFTHIFIDEAGQGKEPEVMVPIKSNADEKTNIIIAGDNQQLGPIVHSTLAKTLGLKNSYLERIMDRDIYGLDTGGRGITIVKLIKNFRSHPDILQFPNEQFYDSELQPCGDPVLINSLENFEDLPKKRFPMIFHGLIGKDQQESKSPSFFNIDEITQVKKYCHALLDDRKKRLQASDIGVITPYHAQRCKILDVLHKDIRTRDIKVGSVEEFQGQERRIIIISTVRSNTHYITSDIRRALGFVANDRRFNVAITRAQALLIVIGNPIVLSLDPLWRAFMNFVHRRGGWRGKQIDWDPEDPVAPGSSADYAAERRRQAGQNIDDTMQRIQSLIMQKHEDSDYEIDFGDDSDDEAGAFERPILREAE